MSPEANRVVEANFPDSIQVSDVALVDEAMVRQWAMKFPSVGLVIVGSGPPYQGVSKLNCDRKGAMKDSRSSLFQHVPRISGLVKKVFVWAQVHSLFENVASMDWDDCQAMNDGYGLEPWFIDAHGVSLCYRPRLYWITWELPDDDKGVNILKGSAGQLPIQGEVQLTAQVETNKFLEPGWRKNNEKPFPTFTTSRPSPTPLRRPAGLHDCNAEERARWAADLHRFPPYQYKDIHCLVSRDGALRPPNVAEREVILGFPINYTKQCMRKSFHGTMGHKDARLTLLGNSWSVPVISWLIAQLLLVLGLIPSISL